MRPDRSTHLRENAAAYAVALALAALTFLVLFLIGTGYFFSILFAVAVLGLIGLGHYLIWGRAMRQEVMPRRPNDQLHRPDAGV